MKFTKVVFTHPRTVFGSESRGTIETEANERGTPVDSIEAVGHWLVVRRGDAVKAVPCSAVENADVLVEPAQAVKKAG